MNSNKTKVLFFVLLFLNQGFSQNSQSTFYLSPGIGIIYDFKNNLLIDLKLSIGKMESELRYYNITIGKRINIKTASNEKKINYYYSDFQYGYFGNLYPFSFGSGFGAVFYNKIKIYPKLDFFIGSGLFANMDYILFMNKLNFGFQTILPLCNNSRYRRLSQ